MTDTQAYRMQCYVARLVDAEAVNQAIVTGYAALRDAADIRRSHFFGGRYENIYVGEDRLPALQPVMREARRLAAEYLQQPGLCLSVGYWLNEMGPGHATLPHKHDEDDELVSGVYYVSVPDDSGTLLLRHGMVETRVTPMPGQFVFFPPDVVHEVSVNRSDQVRLSIGMNFGIRD